MIKLLFHPHVTLAATIGAVTAMAAASTSFVAVLNPLNAFSTLQPIVHRVDGDLIAAAVGLSVLAGALTIVAGLGRSFAPMVDQALTNGTQPLYH
jgi:hypothetical protein